MKELITMDNTDIQNKIFTIHDVQVILDRDLATLYQRFERIEQRLFIHDENFEKIELKRFNVSHDRFLIIDEKEVYHIGASLKDLGQKWFAFSKMDIDSFEIIGKLK